MKKILNKRYKRTISFISLIVITVVTFVYIHSAITAEEINYCKMNSHQHIDQCYDNEQKLICGYADYVVHKHDENCYDKYGNLICGLPEIEEHIHTDECYSVNKVLLCDKKEIILHTHTQECYNNGKLVCGKFQVQKHQHTKNCFKKNKINEDNETIVGHTSVNFDENQINKNESITITETDQPKSLKVDDYITEAKLFYEDSNSKWIIITDETQNVPGDATVKLEVKYQNVGIDKLQEAGYKMEFKLPSLLKEPVASGNIMDGQNIIGTISSSANSVIIQFKKEWINSHDSGDTINGDFFVKSQFDGSHVEEGEPGKIVIGDVEITVNFEEDVAAKHGNVIIEKSKPIFKDDETGTFLKYTLTVKVPEGSAAVPDVKIVDQFTKNIKYVEEYIGVTGDKVEIPDQQEGKTDKKIPFETRPNNSDKGKIYLGNVITDASPIPEPAGDALKKPGILVWEIGKMSAGDIRTLTYEVKLKDNYKGANRKNNSVDIENTASVYSKIYFRNDSIQKYIPNIHVTLNKKDINSISLDDGGKEITYKIVVHADKNNTYTVQNVKLSDYFVNQELISFIDYKDDSFCLYEGNSTESNKKIDLEIVKPENVSRNPSIIETNDNPKKKFNLYIGSLKPGEEKTITYKVKIKPEFFVRNNGNITLSNRALVYSDDRYEGGNQQYEAFTYDKTITCAKKSRKLVGVFSTEDRHIEIPKNQDVYEIKNNMFQMVNNKPNNFIVPAYNQEYQLVVNEEGILDFSDVTFTDTLKEKQMQHTGYLKIEGYNIRNPIQGVVPDKEAIEHIKNIENSTLERTVWLDIEGKNKFSFKPLDLGFSGKKAYIITYYTCIANPDNQHHLKIHNDFMINGNALNSNGDIIIIPNINVNTETTIQGKNHYKSEKIGWYYERPTSNVQPHWNKGELYWAIKINGNKIPKGMKVKDIIPNTNEHKLYENESLVGVYKGSFPEGKSLKDYRNIKEFKSSSGLQELNGKYSKNPIDDTFDYRWEVREQNKYLFLEFNKEISLNEKNGEALYAIIKTAPQKIPQGKRASMDFNNNLQTYHLGSDQWKDEASTKLTIYGSNEIFKETQGAYTYDGTTWKTLVSKDIKHDNANFIEKSLITEPGTYIEWLVHINWDGSMKGLAEIEDQLPEGVELSYVRYYWLSPFYTEAPQSIPITSEIKELKENPDWIRKETNVGSQEYNNPKRQCVYYYNKDTGKVRWNVDGLESGGTIKDDRAVEFQVVCKVIDSNILMSGKEVTINNRISVTNNHMIYTDSDDITLKKNTLNKTAKYDSSIHGGTYPFKIELNPLGESLIPNVETVTIVDELSATLTIDPQSIKIFDKNGKSDITKNCHIRIEETINGQIVYFTVPNSKYLEITYDTFVNAKPQETITISNKAHWQGYEVTDSGDVTVHDFSYSAGGSASSNKRPSLKIVKLDKENVLHKLSGAEFSVQEVDDKFNPVGNKHTAITDSKGEAIFSESSKSEERWMDYNKVYCLKEEQAPDGYVQNETPYYFAIAKTNDKLQGFPENVYVWYQSPQYTYTAYNRKGEIKVDKVFKDSKGEIISPLDGTYRFGIYKNNEKLEQPLQTLKIIYNGKDITYQRDDYLTSEPIFSDLDINENYSIYELDDEGKPIENNKIASISGKSFTVSYSNNNITLNDKMEENTATVINKVKQFKLPITGGNGTMSYFVVGSTLLLIAVIGYFLKKRKEDI